MFFFSSLAIVYNLIDILTAYTIYTLDNPNICNQSIYLEHGPNSAAILKLTSKESYSTKELYCTVNFKAPIHKWSGLTGILEEMDLRKYVDNGHHLGQSFCVDHIRVLTEKPDSTPTERQCGTWSITPEKSLSTLGYNRALFGNCLPSEISRNAEKCHVAELKIIVSIGRERQDLWKNVTWGRHKGFTFVVTAYSYPIKHGETECRDGLRSCNQANTSYCVHDSLWCDGHVNCGFSESMDEISCFKNGVWGGGLMSIVVGPWIGISIFLLLLFCGVLYWRASRVRLLSREAQSNNQEINSYAESYELSSNVSSAHHMAIQVRVVCNSNHPHHSTRGALQPWKDDLPPSYEALFPQGPPQNYAPITSIIATVAQGSSGSAVSTVGVNVSSTMSVPSTVISTSGANPHPVPMQSTIHSNSNLTRPPTDITSIIDLNVTSNNFQPPIIKRSSDARTASNFDATVSGASSQTSVTLTLTPSRHLSGDEHESVLQNNERETAELINSHNSMEANWSNRDIDLSSENNFDVQDGQTQIPIESCEIINSPTPVALESLS